MVVGVGEQEPAFLTDPQCYSDAGVLRIQIRHEQSMVYSQTFYTEGREWMAL